MILLDQSEESLVVNRIPIGLTTNQYELGPASGPILPEICYACEIQPTRLDRVLSILHLSFPILSHTESDRQLNEPEPEVPSAHATRLEASARGPGLGFCSVSTRLSVPAMSGREVREYTNLSDPKGARFFCFHQFVDLPSPPHLFL
jgi:hypothetical protein